MEGVTFPNFERKHSLYLFGLEVSVESTLPYTEIFDFEFQQAHKRHTQSVLRLRAVLVYCWSLDL